MLTAAAYLMILAFTSTVDGDPAPLPGGSVQTVGTLDECVHVLSEAIITARAGAASPVGFQCMPVALAVPAPEPEPEPEPTPVPTRAAAPANFAATWASDTEVALSWSATAGAVGYRVYVDGAEVGQTYETSHVVTVPAGSRAAFAVASWDSTGGRSPQTTWIRAAQPAQ